MSARLETGINKMELRFIKTRFSQPTQLILGQYMKDLFVSEIWRKSWYVYTKYCLLIEENENELKKKRKIVTLAESRVAVERARNDLLFWSWKDLYNWAKSVNLNYDNIVILIVSSWNVDYYCRLLTAEVWGWPLPQGSMEFGFVGMQ